MQIPKSKVNEQLQDKKKEVKNLIQIDGHPIKMRTSTHSSVSISHMHVPLKLLTYNLYISFSSSFYFNIHTNINNNNSNNNMKTKNLHKSIKKIIFFSALFFVLKKRAKRKEGNKKIPFVLSL